MNHMLRDVHSIKKLYWRFRILSLGRWYYYIDFGDGIEVRGDKKEHSYSGFKNWDNFLSKHLPPLEEMRILDIGCNAGLYALRMADAGAKEVVGMDLDTAQAEFVKYWFARRTGRDYSCIHYIQADVTKYSLHQLGQFDLACMFCVAYHLGKEAQNVVAQVSRIAPVIAIQGNVRRLTHPKYNRRPYHQYGGVEGMSNLLKHNGYRAIKVIAPPMHPKPLVIGYRAWVEMDC